MGLSDRDYSRGSSWSPSTPWSPGQQGLAMTIILIIVNVAVFFIDMILSGSTPQDSVLAKWLEVRPATLIQPWTWYQFLTYGFVHSLLDIRHLAFNMLGLYIFGTAVERGVGRNEFLRFYLAAVLFSGLVSSVHWVVMSFATGTSLQTISPGTIGASGAIMAVTILFALRDPHAIIYFMMVFPIPAWLLAVLYVGMNVLGMIGASDNVAYDVHLAGAAFAALYFYQGWRLDRFDRTGWKRAISQFTSRRPRLRLHDPERTQAKEEAEADRLLDKIQASGLDSLTAAERRTLEKHSRRKRESRGRFE